MLLSSMLDGKGWSWNLKAFAGTFRAESDGDSVRSVYLWPGDLGRAQ